jgi:cell division protein FtsW
VNRADRLLLVIPLVMVAGGLVLVYSASSILGLSLHGDAFHYASRQLARAVLGVVALVALSRLDYHRLSRYALPLFIGALLLLAVMAVLGVGATAGGARRWIRFLGFGFQPAEIARVVTVIFLAWLINRDPERLQSLSRGYLPALVLLGLACVLVALQPNLSSAAVLFVTGAALLYFAGARFTHLAGTVGIGVVGFLAMIARYDYQRERLVHHMQFLITGKLDSLGSGWQLDQSLIALGSGGVLGRGFGRGMQKFHFLPDPHTDFILSIAGEEGGLLATGAILGAFVLLIWRGYRTALRAPDMLGALLAAGITTQLALYAFVNMGVATGILPTTGLPLPFISYGGSALVMNLAAIGILLNISSQAEDPRPVRRRQRSTPRRRPTRRPAWEGLR